MVPLPLGQGDSTPGHTLACQVDIEVHSFPHPALHMESPFPGIREGG